jgi:hypothetical protein
VLENEFSIIFGVAAAARNYLFFLNFIYTHFLGSIFGSSGRLSLVTRTLGMVKVTSQQPIS